MVLQFKRTRDPKACHKKKDLIHKDNHLCLQELRKNMYKKPQTISVKFKIKKNIKYSKYKKMNKTKKKEEIGWDNPTVNLWFLKIKNWNNRSWIPEYILLGGVMISLHHQLECAKSNKCKKNKFNSRKMFNQCKFFILWIIHKVRFL